MCCVERHMNVMPSLNWKPKQNVWSSSIWYGSAWLLCLLMWRLQVRLRDCQLSQPNHCAFGVIEVDAGDARHHEFLPFLADRLTAAWLFLSLPACFPGLKFFRLAWTWLPTARDAHLTDVSIAASCLTVKVPLPFAWLSLEGSPNTKRWTLSWNFLTAIAT